jgi:hypothetical protein
MLVAIGSMIAATQSKATQETLNAIVHFLNYAASHPDAVIWTNEHQASANTNCNSPIMSEPHKLSNDVF